MTHIEWEKIVLPIIVGVGGFLGGLFTKLLLLVIPGYNDLIKSNEDLMRENDLLRDKNEGLRDDNEMMAERIDELERGIREQ